jgi:hypothetical protein
VSEAKVTQMFIEAFDLLVEQVCQQMWEAGIDDRVVWTGFREALSRISIASAAVEAEENLNPKCADDAPSVPLPAENKAGMPNSGKLPSHVRADPRHGRLRKMARRAAGR